MLFASGKTRRGCSLLREARAESRCDSIERVGEIRPCRSRIGTEMRERARRAAPPGSRRLRGAYFLVAHSCEIVVCPIVLTHMVEAKQGVAARPVERAWGQRRAILACLPASEDRALDIGILDASVKPVRLRCHAPYIEAMDEASTGPVAREMIERLSKALKPSKLELDDNSDVHIGHAGHDGRGESHFSLVIESMAFAGKNRVERQRMVYAALGELMHERVHALQIKASVPETYE